MIFHFKDKLKENLLAMAKSQVDKTSTTRRTRSRSRWTIPSATLVDGYVYAPDLPYGLTNSLKKGGIFTGLAKVGTTFNRARNAYALNFLQAERQLGMLQAMRDEIRRLKYQDKAFDVSGKWVMVAQPWSYLDFGTGQLNAKLTSEVLRRLLCFFSNLGTEKVTGAATQSRWRGPTSSGRMVGAIAGRADDDMKRKQNDQNPDRTAMTTLGSVVDQVQAAGGEVAGERKRRGMARPLERRDGRTTKKRAYEMLGVEKTATPDEIKTKYDLLKREAEGKKKATTR